MASSFAHVCKRFTDALIARAHSLPHTLECVVFGAFFATMLLSFPGLLNSPFIYAGAFGLCTYLYWLFSHTPHEPLTGETAGSHRQQQVIACFVIFFLFLSFFMFPVTADAQRVKLARILLGVNEGSAWSTGRMDPLSLMYYMPAPFYLIFTPMEALHLPRNAYAVFNAFLMLGSLLSLLTVVGRQAPQRTLFFLVLFFAAPQFLFSGLEENEDALTFFLITRALFWLFRRPLSPQTMLAGVLCAVMATAIKYPAAFFIVLSALAMAVCYQNKSQLLEYLRLKNIAIFLGMLVISTLVILIPDTLVASDRGLTILDNIIRLSQYHNAAGSYCALPHFLLRLFEMGSDIVRIVLNSLRLDFSAHVPAYNFLPPRCAYDDTSLASYLRPVALGRDSTQYGAVPLVALAGIFITRGTSRRKIAFCLVLFLAGIAFYAAKTMFWSGTGRYLMVNMLILLPAFLFTMEALQASRIRFYACCIVLTLIPAFFIGIRGLDNIPRTFTQGDRITHRIHDLLPRLNDVHGPANIYFNDLIPYYTLLRAIPSHDVTIKKEIVPGITNIIFVPQEYSENTNWHDKEWLLPVPSERGEYVGIKPGTKNVGNIVPTMVYVGTPGRRAEDANAVQLFFVNPALTPENWVKTMGSGYNVRAQKFSDGAYYYLQSNNAVLGLCLRYSKMVYNWQITKQADCIHP